MENKPSWNDAPVWARYLTGDADGWYWWERRPGLTFQHGVGVGRVQEHSDDAPTEGQILFEERP